MYDVCVCVCVYKHIYVWMNENIYVCMYKYIYNLKLTNYTEQNTRYI
jgi:hypothetical protein